MATFNDYGKTIKKRLIDMEKPQKWLIQEVSRVTGLYFDDSYLNKIMTGKIATPSIVRGINQVLSIEENQKKEGT